MKKIRLGRKLFEQILDKFPSENIIRNLPNYPSSMDIKLF
jgi:hypothetical protein